MEGLSGSVVVQREDLWQERPAKRPEDRIRYSKAFLDSIKQASGGGEEGEPVLIGTLWGVCAGRGIKK